MKIISVLRDKRLCATSVLTEMTMEEYVNIISSAQDNLDIQRKIIKGFKPYERLREDLKEGCIIPPIVLGLRTDENHDEEYYNSSEFIDYIKHIDPQNIFIIDGLQRTNAILNVYDKKNENFPSTRLRIEIWPDITLSALVYRMILLNAGQKPMSLKHQLEVVSLPLCERLQEIYSNQIQIFREKDSRRRSNFGQYRFSIIAQAFQAFIQKTPHIDIRNEVISELNEIDVLTNYGDALGKDDKHDLTWSFEEYIGFLLKFDKKLCLRYSESDEENSIPTGVNLLSRETFHLGLAAAYGWALDRQKDSLEKSKVAILDLLSNENIKDPLSLERLEKIQTGFKRKDNTGEQTRNLIYNGFREYFRSDGLTSFEECWLMA